jgi:acyl-CoA thioesterase-1
MAQTKGKGRAAGAARSAVLTGLTGAALAACQPSGASGTTGSTPPAAGGAAVGTSAAAGQRADGAAAGARRPARVVFIGTSLTAGLGLDPDSAYPALVERKASAAGTPITAVNAGVSGETSSGALRRVDWVLREPADWIVVETGANDGLRGQSPEALKQNLAEIVRRARAAQPQARVALVQMEAPRNLGATYVRRFHGVYPEVAREAGVPLLPFLLEGVAGVSSLNQPDGVHPNEEGERRVAENVWRALGPLLASPAGAPGAAAAP